MVEYAGKTDDEVKEMYQAELKAKLAAAEAENTGLLQELDDYIRIRKINVKRLGEFEEENGRLRGLLVRASGFAYHFGPAILKADIRAVLDADEGRTNE